MAVNENLNYRNVRRGGEGRILPINRDHAIKPWLPSPRKRFSNKRCNHRSTIQTLVILTIIAFNIACAGVYRQRDDAARREMAQLRRDKKSESFASRSIRSIDIILNSDSFLQLSTIIFDMFRSLINYGIFVSFFFFFYIHIAISPMKRSIKILFHSFIHFEIRICRESKRIFSNDSKPQYFHSSR